MAVKFDLSVFEPNAEARLLFRRWMLSVMENVYFPLRSEITRLEPRWIRREPHRQDFTRASNLHSI